MIRDSSLAESYSSPINSTTSTQFKVHSNTFHLSDPLMHRSRDARQIHFRSSRFHHYLLVLVWDSSPSEANVSGGPSSPSI